MRLRVLGPVRAGDETRPVDLGGRQQRLVLALLTSRANQAVSMDRLVEDIWGTEAPASARKAVEAHLDYVEAALSDRRTAERNEALARQKLTHVTGTG